MINWSCEVHQAQVHKHTGTGTCLLASKQFAVMLRKCLQISLTLYRKCVRVYACE